MTELERVQNDLCGLKTVLGCQTSSTTDAINAVIAKDEEIQRLTEENAKLKADVLSEYDARTAQMAKDTPIINGLVLERDEARGAFESVHTFCGFGYPSWLPGQDQKKNATEVCAYISAIRAELETVKQELGEVRSMATNYVHATKIEREEKAAELSALRTRLKDEQECADELSGECEDHAFLVAHVRKVTRHVAGDSGIHSGKQFDALMDDVRALAKISIDESSCQSNHLRTRLEVAGKEIEVGVLNGRRLTWVIQNEITIHESPQGFWCQGTGDHDDYQQSGYFPTAVIAIDDAMSTQPEEKP